MNRKDVKAFLTTGLIVSGLLIVSFLAREVLGLRHGEFLTALLILTVILFLVISGRLSLEKITLLGVSADLIEAKLRKNIQQEQERLVFLGKLDQALTKSTSKKEELCLLYADIDKLRDITRKRFNKYRSQKNRKREIDIRKQYTKKLAECLEDAFFDLTQEGSKLDLFELVEPDYVMMVRGVDREKAEKIGNRAIGFFEDNAQATVTISLLSDKELSDENRTASEMDMEAGKRLKTGKEFGPGKLYPLEGNS